MFQKGIHLGFFNKGVGGKLLGAAANVLDNPLTGLAVGAIAPEFAPGLAALKKSGVLEKLKH